MDNERIQTFPLHYDPSEQDVLMDVFADMLRAVTKDGGVKRAKSLKPEWWRDPSHEAAIFSHLSKWKHGEFIDKDSGQHPLVHMAWRALAIAYQETKGLGVDPAHRYTIDDVPVVRLPRKKVRL